MLECFQNYAEKIMRRKKWFLPAILISVILFSISTYYLYSGINKRFILYSLLSLGTGVLLVCPRVENIYVSFLSIILYLVTVPSRIFRRMELPLYDMTGLLEGAELVNVLIILLVYAIFLLILQRVRFALGGANIFLLILFLINYYVCQFRGSSLSAVDLLATRTALTVLDSYRLTMSSELWYSILWFTFFIILGFWCDIPVKGKKYHISVTILSLSCILAFYTFWNKSDYFRKHDLQNIYWTVNANELLNGFLLSFAFSAQDFSMDKPGDYSEEKLMQLIEEVQEAFQPQSSMTTSLPHIICIMNEAWSDLRVLGNLETSEDFMPLYDSLSEKAVTGYTYVDILGGLTANTEFEMLTGDSLTFLSPTAVPYQLQVNHEMYSVARVLREQGYSTMAMHPSVNFAWNRDKVYDYFGFEEFVDISQFETELQYVGGYISDECNFKEIIRQYENREKDKPLFLFDVTIQNHGGYGGNTAILLNAEKIGNVPAKDIGDVYDLDTYLNLIKLTDEAFEMLLAYFEKEEEPVIICMFGDHQPRLGDNFYDAIFRESNLSEEDRQALKYITPYVIWNNFEADFPVYGDMSANYLGAAVLECAGTELPPYYQFLLELQKKYPVISRGKMNEMKGNEMIKQYQMLQYNHLMERNYLKELFSVLQ